MNSQFDGGATNADILEDWLLQVFKATKQSQNKKEQASNLSLSYKTDVTVNLTRFEELLMTMTMAQKINKSGWMDPSDDWGQSGGYDMPRCSKQGKSRGIWVTGASRRESYLSFSILSSLKKTVSQGQGNLRQ